jgi:hypothetical protein
VTPAERLELLRREDAADKQRQAKTMDALIRSDYRRVKPARRPRTAAALAQAIAGRPVPAIPALGTELRPTRDEIEAERRRRIADDEPAGYKSLGKALGDLTAILNDLLIASMAASYVSGHELQRAGLDLCPASLLGGGDRRLRSMLRRGPRSGGPATTPDRGASG